MVNLCKTTFGTLLNEKAAYPTGYVANDPTNLPVVPEQCATFDADIILGATSTPNGGRKLGFVFAGRQENRAVLDESGERIPVEYDETTGELVRPEGGEDYVPVYEYDENDEVVGSYWARPETDPFRYQSNRGENGGRFIHPQFKFELGGGVAISRLVKQDEGKVGQELIPADAATQVASPAEAAAAAAKSAYDDAVAAAGDTAAATATAAVEVAVANANTATTSITRTAASYRAAAAAYTAAAAAYTAAATAYTAAAATTTEYTAAATVATQAATAYTAAAMAYSNYATVLARPLTEFQGGVKVGLWGDITDYSAALQVPNPNGNGGMVDQVDTTVPNADKIYRMRAYELGLYLKGEWKFVSRTQPFDYVDSYKDETGTSQQMTRRGYIGVIPFGWYFRGGIGLFIDGPAGGNGGRYAAGVPGSTSDNPEEDVSLRWIRSNDPIVHAVVDVGGGVILPGGLVRVGGGVRSEFLPVSYKRDNPIETIEGDSLLVSGVAGNHTAENDPVPFNLSRSAMVYGEVTLNFWEPGRQIQQAALRASAQ